jgi:hypothetical protein
MTSHEQQRLRLHQSLERQIGEDMAGVLMSSLPPFDWNQVATKDDLKVFATRDEMNLKFAEVNATISDLGRSFEKSLRVTTQIMAGAMLTCFGILFTCFGILFTRI